VGGTNALEFLTDAVSRVLLSNIKYIGSNLDDTITSSFGNDLLLGRKGDDELGGGAGKDTMTGGAGHDTFHFAAGDGKDTVTDFDADGGVGNQDLIGANFVDATSIDQVGANTVIHFGAGDSLTLLHVDKTHIDATDFTV
jgi:Ca2+-binding RTX toxin-like protein